MLSFKVRDLSRWVPHPERDYFNSVGGNVNVYGRNRLVQRGSNYHGVESFYDYPYLLISYRDTEVAYQLVGEPVSEPFNYCLRDKSPAPSRQRFACSLLWTNAVISLKSVYGSETSDKYNKTITDNGRTLSAHDARLDEQLHNTIKKMTKENTTCTKDMTNDEKYVVAILRPNIMTSELYANNFMASNDISFRYNIIDDNKKVMLSNVQGWKAYYQNKFPGCTVSVEQGVFKESTILSLRFVVMDADRNIVVVWLVASSSYSIHYKNLDDVRDLLAYLETLHVPKKRTIKRCYNGGKELAVNTVVIDGRFQVHDEFTTTAGNPFAGKSVSYNQATVDI